MDAALELAARDPPPVAAALAEEWLPARLAEARPGVLTLVWESVIWQYLPMSAQESLYAALHRAGAAATEDAPLAWLRMEPGSESFASGFEVRLTTWPDGHEREIARAGEHGPPVRWA